MGKALHVIYIPGLGDEIEPRGQLKAVARWQKYGVEAELFRMYWGDGELWQPKFNRLLAQIDGLSADGKIIGLIGASAGASAAINAFAVHKNKIAGVVLIAGKVNRPDKINPQHNTKNPAFVESVKQCVESLKRLRREDRRRILSRYGVYDGYVKRADSFIPGAINRRAPTFGHFLNIALQLTVGAKSAIDFIQQQQASDRKG